MIAAVGGRGEREPNGRRQRTVQFDPAVVRQSFLTHDAEGTRRSRTCHTWPMARSPVRLTVAVLAMALFGACSSADPSGSPRPSSATTATADSTEAERAQPADSETGDTGPPGADTSPSEARDPIADITENGWGVVDGRLRGPGGLDLDLSRCPPEPPADGPIRIGTNVAAGLIDSHDDALTEAFAAVNADGGIGGRPLELITAVEDNGHLINTDGMVSQLLAPGELSAIVPAGSAADEADRAAIVLAEACTPGLLWLGTGPSPTPWVTNGVIDVRSELALARAWLATIDADNLLLVVPEGADGFMDEAIDAFDVADGATVTVAEHGVDRPLLVPVGDPLLDHYDGAVIASSGTGCTQGPAAVRDRYPEAEIVTIGALCPEWSFRPEYLAPGEGRLDGVVQLFWTRPPRAGAAAELRPDRLRTEAGRTADALIELLRVADGLDGGVNRANLLLAAHYLDATPADAAEGVRLRTNGPDDPFALESGVPHRWQAASQRWQPLPGGAVVDADGATPRAERRPPAPFEPDPCLVADRSTMSTSHWFPTEEGGDVVDPRADIVLYVPSDTVALATTAELVASTLAGTEVRLPLQPLAGRSCRADRVFDLPLGDADALTDLGPAFTVRFEFDDGAWSTNPVQWPDDFERVVPFDPTPLVRSPETDGGQPGG